jgi:hypothetical protein
MRSTAVRISEHARGLLADLASQTGESMGMILERAIEDYSRRRLLEAANALYAALRNDPKTWREELEERALWENTLMDGLEDNE